MAAALLAKGGVHPCTHVHPPMYTSADSMDMNRIMAGTCVESSKDDVL